MTKHKNPNSKGKKGVIRRSIWKKKPIQTYVYNSLYEVDNPDSTMSDGMLGQLKGIVGMYGPTSHKHTF